MKKTLFILALILISSAVALYSALPLLINHASPYILAKYGRAHTTLTIDKLSSRTVVAGLTLRSDYGHVVELPRITASFSLKDLVKKKIDTVLINGGVIHLEMVDGALQLYGIGSGDEDEESAQTLPSLILPFVAEDISIKNLSIIVHREENKDIEFIVDGTVNIDATISGDAEHLLDNVQGTFTSRGDLPGTLEFIMDGNDELINVHSQLATHNLGSLSSLFLPPSLQLYGTAELETDIILNKELNIRQSTTELKLTDLLVTSPSLTIESPPQELVRVTLEGHGAELNYTISTLQLTHRESGLSFFTSPAGTLRPAGLALMGQTSINSPLLSEPIAVNLNGINMPDGYHLTASLSGNYQRLKLPAMNIETGPYSISADLVNKDGRASVKTDIGIDFLIAAEENVRLNTISAQLSGITRSTPFGNAQGKLNIGNIIYRSEDMGSAAFTLSSAKHRDNLQFNGSVKGGFADNFKLDVQGSVNSEMQLQAIYTIPPVSLNSTSFPSFMDAGEDLLFGGIVSGKGEVHYPPTTGATNLNLRLKQGYVKQEKSKLELSGIAADITFPHLPSIHSSPSQLVTVQSLKLNTLNATEADLYIRIEDDLSLFLEKSRLRWCGGKVEVAATKISPHLEDFSTTMYCDRLQFSELLNQFGIPDTEGDGSLNGRLPVDFSSDGLFFDDGFLFSTPGNSGIVRFNSTEILQQGLPDMSQAAYLDYSLMALKNFSYNWTKLTFNSIGNDLLISMQIDGKPAKPLPFGYKNGHIVANPKGKGIQHPLQLTVNFNLPLREMFRYGQNLQKIMERM